MDGAANQKGSGVGLVVISPDKIIIEKSSIRPSMRLYW